MKFCGLGLKVPELVQSQGNQVTVQFMSGTHRGGRGFHLSYATTDHPGTRGQRSHTYTHTHTDKEIFCTECYLLNGP